MQNRRGSRSWSRVLLTGALLLGVPGCDDEDDGGGDGTDGAPLDGDPSDGNDGDPTDGTDGDPTDGTDGDPLDGDPGDGDAGLDGGADAGSDAEVPVVGDVWAVTSAADLVSLDPSTGALQTRVAITGLATDEVIVGADVRPADGLLYALTNQSRILTIAADGTATPKSTLSVALTGTTFGVDFNPVANRLRVVGNDEQNLRVDVDTGTTTADTALTPTAYDVTAAAYTNNFAAACRTRLYVIDTLTQTLLLQDPPNEGVLTVVGTFGTGVDAVAGFEIVTAEDGTNTALVGAIKDDKSWLATLDLSTGGASGLVELALEAGETLVAFSAAPPATAPAQPRGELVGITTGNKLVSFQRGAPGKLCTTVDITGLATEEDILGADIRPATGDFVAVGSTGVLYNLDLTTGAATQLSALNTLLTGEEFGVGFNPVPDRLRILGDDDANYRVDVGAGTVTTDTALTATAGSVGAVTALAYTNSFAGTKSTTLFGIDSTNDTLVTVGGSPATGGMCPGDANNPNCGVVDAVGPLGVDTGAINGFDIDARTGVALAALSVAAGTTPSTLYSVDLTTGTATALGGVGGGEALRALAFAAQPVLTTYALGHANQLVTLALNAPSTPTANHAITGLQDNEVVLGIDVRPADGKLYGLGSSGRLYTLDPSTGAATLVSTLSAAEGDDNPFTTLPETNYALDFNPVADRLRSIAVRDDENLRSVPGTGATFTDALLNPGDPGVAGAAYTHSFAGATSTTLYVIDMENDVLARQGGFGGTPSPNTGTLTTVGPLGLDIELADVGFDIVGGHDGLVVAAVVLTGSTSSTLYTVNLVTGALTAFNATNNTIGDGSFYVRGLALELK